ncbi:hypothetical protein EHS13_31355 [Paenibacillus psychroresistens]|uniref:Uncharacterized protein n=1 Tax=Paenibacillus psychroresistens TaxID=1778678 RepID=A0A6B8RUU1_9BACL|nr:hypothetical protein [Paenibacillus psychroresistens]QGQ99056.1 hypothetical protein EHS13_31355 [Paenibacillus psychroresistens]
MSIEVNNDPCAATPSDYKMTWTSAAQAMWAAVKLAGKAELELYEVMGLTGHAFRININPENVDIAGPTAYPWETFFAKGLKNIGFNTAYVRTADFTPPTPDQLTRALKLVQKSIDRGVPAISWDLFVPEFGVLYGYNDEKQELQGKDPNEDGTLLYEKLGRGQIHELFVMILEEEIQTTALSLIRGALEIAIDHAHRREHSNETPPFQNGLAGYDGWIEAFEAGKVSEIGNAYNLAVVADARAHAAKFLQEMADRWESDGNWGEAVVLITRGAAGHYARTTDALNTLLAVFPFPQGGEPNDAETAKKAIAVLQTAKAAEASGVEALERLLAELPE